ncbi:retrovirus-related pol polyprotein from transposon TNT 1-94 [Tanacetum coccineum]
MKFKKTKVEDYHRISSISNKTKSVTVCNDSLKSRTSNVNVVSATCGKYVFNSNPDAYVSKFIHDVNAITKKPKVVPISTRKPKSQANKSVATPPKKTVASESTIQKSKSYYKMLYEKTSKAWKWWIEKQCPSGSNLSCIPSSSNSLADCSTHPTVSEGVNHRTNVSRPQLKSTQMKDKVMPNNSQVKFKKTEIEYHHRISSISNKTKSVTVAFRKSTCFVRDLQGNDLLTGNRGSDIYIISLQETTLSTPIYFMAKASPTQACPMRIKSINEKKYILVIIDDYPRYTWTHFLRTKDESPEVIKDFLEMIQRNLHAQVITVRTDKGKKFLNKTLHAYFKEEGIEHQTSTPRTPEQNGVVERRNRTLVEAARIMLSTSKLPLFF